MFPPKKFRTELKHDLKFKKLLREMAVKDIQELTMYFLLMIFLSFIGMFLSFKGFPLGLMGVANALILFVVLVGIIFFDRSRLFEKEIFHDFLKKHDLEKKLLFKFYEDFPIHAERILYVFFIFEIYVFVQILLLSVLLWPIALVLFVQLVSTILMIVHFKETNIETVTPVFLEMKKVLDKN